ncbi:DUF2218 domain-containing protein [Skermanella rosea]|uniref:DUF2218 domain-containing protein n=1 Tax=Skermanella rosea TaxID=1817965 RepID=UPI0019314F71|nr:DUF2218 domain-containing protein [Skermanella rosea]UEM06249.1 DUF2218 domain-containing protein [Skermanella rosea]
MFTSVSHVATDKAERFMTQLCKHFAHKIPASSENGSGRIQFEAGTCLLESGPEFLTLRVEAGSDDQRTIVEDVVKSHLERFMWKEPAEITWNRG